ncbi:MAG: phosphate ABC transporter permease subunit PstC [Pseudomonadota bacterium]|nr:MAG: phosphate ABC transporter permease subunit PstC [Pseudomonadota bacterium]
MEGVPSESLREGFGGLETASSRAVAATPDPAGSRLRRRKAIDRAARWIITLIASTAIAAVALIFLFLAREAFPILTSAAVHEEVTLGKMIFPQPWREGEPAYYAWQPVSKVPKYSLLPLLVGTFKVALIALIFAVPVAVLGAVFTSELAPRRVREIVKPAVELLAGIPSVVLGFFVLMVLATHLQDLFGLQYRLNTIVAGIGLGLTIVPVIFTLSEDALTAVPQRYREAAFALGASRTRTAWSVVLPAASPGIFAAIVLGFGRAMGETMIVLMASGNAAILSWDPTLPVRTVPATIAAEMGEVVVGGPHWTVLFVLGVLLLLLTIGFNGLSGWYVRRLRQRLGGTS